MSAGTIALRLVIGGDSKGAQAALKGLGTAGGRAGKALKVAQTGAAIGLTAIVGVAAKGVQSYETLVKSAAALQRQSKISAEDASLLTGQWQRYGVSAEAGGKGVMMLSKQIDAANIGTQTSIDSFARLGITLDDLKTMSPYQVLEQVRSTLSQMPPSAERTALSAKLLGRGFMSMSKWIAASSTDLDALNQQLRDSGQVMDEAELTKAKDDLKQMALLQVDLRGLLVEVGRSAMPILRDLVPPMKKLLAVVKPLAPHLVEIGGALATFLVVSKLATGLTAMVGALRAMKLLLAGGGLARGLADVAGAGAGGGFVKGPGGKLVAQSLIPGAAGAGGVGSGAAAAGGAGVALPVIVVGVWAAALTGIGYLLHKQAEENRASGKWTSTPSPSAGPTPGPSGSGATAFVPRLDSRVLAPLEARLAELRKKWAADYALGKLDDGPILDQMAGLEKQINAVKARYAAFASGVQHPMAVGHLKNQVWIDGLNQGITRAAYFKNIVARPMAVGHLKTSGWTGAISAAMQKLLEFRDLAEQGITPGSLSQHKSWTAAHSPATPAWHAPGRALGGYVRRTPGGTLLRVGEGKYDEVVAQVLPGKGEQKARGGDNIFNLYVDKVIGTDERAARQLWNTVKPIAMSDMRMKMAMSRG